MASWPVLKQYDVDHLRRIALPLGGIGTGTISLGGRGDFRDCELFDRPAKGDRGIGLFFCMRTEAADGRVGMRLLEGPLDLDDYEGASGSPAFNHGMPRFRDCSFGAAYPLGTVRLRDAGVPVSVRLEAFNPFIPADSEASGIPAALLRYAVVNPGPTPVRVSICGTLSNVLGEADAVRTNTYREDGGLRGLFLACAGTDEESPRHGSLVLATAEEYEISHRTAWATLSWGDSMLDFRDDFLTDGQLDERPPETGKTPRASLCASFEVPAGGERTASFILAWRFPNRITWTPAPKDSDCGCGAGGCGTSDNVGNYYATRYADAWDAARRFSAARAELESRTVRFVETFLAGDLPDVVKEAALFNLSTLRSQTCFRIRDGHFLGWEGCHDRGGCCHGSCTHVWNYEQSTAFLFGDLAVSMRDLEFAHATDDTGLMSFRVGLPLERARAFGKAAADGQMGCIMKMYRDWQLSGDGEWLRRLWPRVRRAVEFCWIPGGWDADRDGVMEGCQHNTMDVEYYGPNPQMAGWYLGALRAAEEMARAVGEDDFAATCLGLFESGREAVDRDLFNGEYYEHHVVPPVGADAIAPSLRVGMGSGDLSDPDLQLGAGCLVDQLVGQFLAHVCGLGYLLDPDHVRTTLAAIRRHNFRRGFHDHFNHMRSYVLGDESALLMATYPRGRRPRRPFPYFNEVMTGFEYAAAVHMLYEGQTDAGLDCIAAIRSRYDGRKRSPFDEAECGHHYARAMAAWGAVLALSGFGYSAPEGTLRFAAKSGRWFWSTGYGWGSCTLEPSASGMRAVLRVVEGRISFSRLIVGSGEGVCPEAPVELGPGGEWSADIPLVTATPEDA